jgi:hypothetical protein
MPLRRSGLIAPLVAVLLLAGCGGDTTAPGAPATPSLSPVPVAPPRSVPPSGTTETLTGTVEAGVEPGCLVLTGTGRDHLLLFADRSAKSLAKVGATVTVVGHAEPTRLTTCQQGIPFVVSSVRVN